MLSGTRNPGLEYLSSETLAKFHTPRIYSGKVWVFLRKPQAELGAAR